MTKASESQQKSVKEIYNRVHESAQYAAAEEHEDHQSPYADAVIHLQHSMRKEVPDDVAAVERRNRYEVEDPQQDIDHHGCIQQRANGHDGSRIGRHDLSELRSRGPTGQREDHQPSDL